MIKIGILRWEDYSRFFRWVQYNHKGSYNRKSEAGETQSEDMMTEIEGRVMDFEDEERHHNLWNSGALQNLESLKNKFTLRNSRRNTGLPKL